MPKSALTAMSARKTLVALMQVPVPTSIHRENEISKRAIRTR
jgi:hypothetical protein